MNVNDRYKRTIQMIRKSRNETQRDMAKRLNISTTKLSLIETGDRQFPADWIDTIMSKYKLSESEFIELESAIYDSEIEEMYQKIRALSQHKREVLEKALERIDFEEGEDWV